MDRPRGQSLVEFAVSAAVLVLMLAGAVDLGRAFYGAVSLQGAARDAARVAAMYDARSRTDPGLPANPNLYDDAILAAVNSSLSGIGMEATKQVGACPAGRDGNSWGNPPYADSLYPDASGRVFLRLCYRTASGDARASLAAPSPDLGQGDVQVVLLMRFGLGVTSGVFDPSAPIAASVHMQVQGP